MPKADFTAVSRRRLLKWGLAAGGFIGMGGVGGLLALRGPSAAVDGLKCLTPHEYRTLASLAAALFPDALGGSDAPIDLARQFDVFIADEPEWNQRDLKRALTLLEFGPLLFDHRLTTFSRLTPAERVAHFEAWSLSDSDTRRQVAVAFRRFLALAFYDRPAAWQTIGYEGPVLRRSAS